MNYSKKPISDWLAIESDRIIIITPEYFLNLMQGKVLWQFVVYKSRAALHYFLAPPRTLPFLFAYFRFTQKPLQMRKTYRLYLYLIILARHRLGASQFLAPGRSRG